MPLSSFYQRKTVFDRYTTLAGVLLAFALVVAGVTVIVLTAVARIDDSAQKLDDRSRQTIAGAIKTFRSQLGATLNDYAEWDDAARNVYANDTEWVTANYGDVGVGGSLFDTAYLLGETDEVLLAYRDGRPTTTAPRDFFAVPFWTIVARVKAAVPPEIPEAAGFVKTEAGIAAVAVALVRPKSQPMTVPAAKRRYLVLARHLDSQVLLKMSKAYLVDGLRVAPPDFVSDYNVRVVDPMRATIGKLVWQSQQPDDAGYRKVRPLVIEALSLVGVFFVIVLFVGWSSGRRLKAEEAEARELAMRDRLSGLFNREGLALGVSRLVVRARRDKGTVLLLYLDLDGFKEINDAYGHGTGDQLIRGVAAGLKVLIPPNTVLARLGGDEFAIAFHDEGEEDAAAVRLAEAILQFFAEPLEVGRRIVAVGASIGIAKSPSGLVEREELVRRADLAMYKAKEAGRGRIALYEADLDVGREARNALELDLIASIGKGELTVEYQPLVHATSQRITGVEALARWTRPGHGRVSPDEFIPVAETSGLIEALGLFVLKTACTAARDWPGLKVAVNVSPGQFRNPAFADQVHRVLEEVGSEPARVTLEITEGYLIQNPVKTRQSIERLKALGVKIALDDFGSGFSSIGYLRQFGFDRIKIDRSLVCSVVESKQARDLLQATVALARALDVPVTGEGIETEEQSLALKLFGCDELQGYFFGKPMSADEITRSLAKQERRREDGHAEGLAAACN